VLERRQALFIFAFRFGLVWGFRTVAPFVIGMSRVPTSRFVLFNTIGAAVWALSVGALGYFFGHGLELLLGDVKRYEREAFLFLVAVGAGLWLVRFLLRRRAAASARRKRDCRPPRPRRLDWPRVFDLGRAREAPPVGRVGGFCW
jgi:membrane protein DedA with SNARE-associated domain